uniref:MULE transposase domain-containing protein n=1 Tax=Schizaphis graminum TaxID=13262 RepID=A0A2S2P9P5_SCHGA
MPSVSVLKRTVRLIRQKEQAAPPNPKTLTELILPENYTTTFDGKPFLLFENGENRILIFSTQKNLQLMEKCDHWYADGTFSTSPNLFYQIYTVHGIQYNNVLPSIFSLLPNKTENTYIDFYKSLKILNESLNQKSIMD